MTLFLSLLKYKNSYDSLPVISYVSADSHFQIWLHLIQNNC